MNQLTAAVPASATVVGHFDYAQDGHAQGWAYDPAHPQQRLKVEILCNDEVVAYGVADRFREDLGPAGIGDGKHLFLLPLSYELLDGQVHTLIAREAKTGVILHGGPVKFGPETRLREFDLINRAQGLELLHKLFTLPAFSAQAARVDSFAKVYRIGAQAQETGRFEDARFAWKSIIQALGNNALCHCKLGETYLLQGQTEAALEAYRAAAAADLRLHWAHLGIANAQRLLGRFSEAEEALEVALALQPHNTAIKTCLEQVKARALPERIDALLASGKRAEAIQSLKRLLLDNPEHPVAQDKLGEILLPRPGFDTSLPGLEALIEFQKAQHLLELALDDAEISLKGSAAR